MSNKAIKLTNLIPYLLFGQAIKQIKHKQIWWEKNSELAVAIRSEGNARKRKFTKNQLNLL